MSTPLPEKPQSIYSNGRLYDLFEKGAIGPFKGSNEDIPLFAKLAFEQGNKVLELGCGTGRISIALAEQGMQVTGLDRSDSMLSVAKEKSSKVHWVNADMSNFDLNEKFDTILIPYNAFLHVLKLQDVQSCLKCVRKHLSSNGKFILDIVHPTLKQLSKLYLYPDKVVSSVFEDPESNQTVVVTTQREYLVTDQVMIMKRVYQYQKTSLELLEMEKFRIYFPQEIKNLLYSCGFTIERIFGHYDQSPFGNDSPNQIIVTV